jgi:hypothetical protein
MIAACKKNSIAIALDAGIRRAVKFAACGASDTFGARS